MTAHGPYESERDTFTEPLLADTISANPGGGVYAALNRIALLNACRDAGVRLGDFDLRIVEWLARLEPSTVQVVIGLISRAHQAGGLSADIRLRQQIARVRALTCHDTDLYDRDGGDMVSVARIRAALNEETE